MVGFFSITSFSGLCHGRLKKNDGQLFISCLSLGCVIVAKKTNKSGKKKKNVEKEEKEDGNTRKNEGKKKYRE